MKRSDAKVLIIDVQYRDGHNFKTSDSQPLNNDMNIHPEELMNMIGMYLGDQDELLADDLGIVNPAPFDNEFLEPLNDYDHPFITIEDVVESDNEPHAGMMTVSKFIQKLKAYSDSAPSKAEIRRQKAIEHLESQLEKLKNEVQEKILLIDSHHGQYVPQIFAMQFRNEIEKQFDQEEAQYILNSLSDPTEEDYWEAWNDLLSADFYIEGKVLVQDEDLWLMTERQAETHIYI